MDLRLRHARGFGLIEIAVTMAIILIAFVPTANMWVEAAKANREIERKSDAVMLAQHVMETDFRNLPYESQASTDSVETDVQLETHLVVTAPSSTIHLAEVTVTAVGDATPIVYLASLCAKEAP